MFCKRSEKLLLLRIIVVILLAYEFVEVIKCQTENDKMVRIMIFY